MSSDHALQRFLARHRTVAVLSYGAVIAGLVALSWMTLADLNERRLALAAATDLLEQIEGRKPSSVGQATGPDAGRTGSPFLEGQTVTVAGAALQQRVTAAVSRVGGNVLSSQVELQGTQAKDGFVSLIASCEVDQPSLQQLLYDLEAGMPFLFVDQLQVQSPQSGIGQEGGARMRVLLGVSGRWQGAK
jgi:general secretion pathway protein M